jgi:hypothetical protein
MLEYRDWIQEIDYWESRSRMKLDRQKSRLEVEVWRVEATEG